MNENVDFLGKLLVLLSTGIWYHRATLFVSMHSIVLYVPVVRN